MEAENTRQIHGENCPRGKDETVVANNYLPTPSRSPTNSPLPVELKYGASYLQDEDAQKDISKGEITSDVDHKNEPLPLEGLGIDLKAPSSSNRPSQDVRKRRTSSNRLTSPGSVGDVPRLSPARIQELTSSPDSIPIRPATPIVETHDEQASEVEKDRGQAATGSRKKEESFNTEEWDWYSGRVKSNEFHFPPRAFSFQSASKTSRAAAAPSSRHDRMDDRSSRPNMQHRPQSTPPNARQRSASRTHSALQHGSRQRRHDESALKSPRIDTSRVTAEGSSAAVSMVTSPVNASQKSPVTDGHSSPMLANVPLPPMSMPIHLELELSADGPSPLYIQRTSSMALAYESSEVKFERLMNFLLLWPELERVLFFGALTCVDSFLYTFTILPLRFFKALGLLLDWLVINLLREIKFVLSFIYKGLPRWRRNRRRASSIPSKELKRLQMLQSQANDPHVNGYVNASGRHSASAASPVIGPVKSPNAANSKHRRSRSTVSALRASHKADLIKGLLIVVSSAVLLRFDASRMYHNIRGQNTIKLYLIFNVLEFGGKLLSAFGQDVLECLFSDAVLERDANGRSRIVRPFCMFVLALIYNIGHSTMLFYQVVTLNVAVNSYSNALLSLLMSNQFVEIKGSVLKKIEKENLFQMTIGDICERFELWLMLTIIALRNLVEVGSLSISISSVLGTSSASGAASNATSAPLTSASILPNAFTVLPRWTGEVLGPFIIVLGSEMFVDYLKHAYISKFNNVKPNIYGRFLDVIAKDYYMHAFGEQSLTKRYGLPLLPLACLSIRAIFQTYHMFLATHMPLPTPSQATSISLESATPSATGALAQIDQIFRRALGRSTFGAGMSDPAARTGWWSVDDVIALGTMLAVFGICWLILLAIKLALGMMLLSFARRRYATMKERERQSVDVDSRRFGAWGAIEVGEDKRKWIYRDDEKALQKLKDRDEKTRREAREGKMPDLTNVKRYDMVGKRIW